VRILHVITDLNTGGAEVMLQKLVTRSQRPAVNHAVVSLSGEGDLGGDIAAAGIPVHSLGLQHGMWRIAVALARLRRVCAAYQPDLLQSWLYHADLLSLCAGTRAGRLPIVWNVRSSFHYGLDKWPVRLCARLSRLPAAVVVNSDAGRRIHTEIGYRPRRWEVIPNGFDTQLFRPDSAARLAVRRQLGVGAETVLIGLVARVDPLKDHRTFITAAGLLAAREPDVKFVLAGEGTNDDEDIARWVAEAALAHRVLTLGRRSDMPQITAALDIATSSSISEGFANVIGEAMAAGVPCTVTDVGDSARIVGATGLTVPTRDPGALAAAWGQMIAWGAAGRACAGAAARRRVEEVYSLDAVSSQYERLYEHLIHG
jgi:glycosyltransferase involved in cell wall biosynthesis